MPYTLTRQCQWPSGDNVVEISAGTNDYTNPDALVPSYPDDGQTFDSPVEAVEAAIRVCEAWRKDGAADAQIGYGATGGMTMPFDACSFDDARVWARERLESLPKCDRCGEILPERRFTHQDLNDQKFCREYCAEGAYLALAETNTVCDSCLDCAWDQGVSDRATMILLMVEMGADVEDHICDATEDKNVACACGCRTERRNEA